MYAGFWKRACALLIDFVVIYATLFIFSLIVFAFLTVFAVTFSSPSSFLLIYTLFFIMGTIGPILYWAILESSSWQATLGKMALGIKVTDINGNRLGFLQSLGRNLGKFISTFTGNIGYAMAGFTVQRQALHDKMADCLVVDKKAKAPFVPLAGTAAYKVILICLLVLVPFLSGMLLALVTPSIIVGLEQGKFKTGVTLLSSIRAMQQLHYAQSNTYAQDFESLGMYLTDDNGMPAKGKSFDMAGDEINLAPTFATAQYLNQEGLKVIIITQCYSTNKQCCSGNPAVCSYAKKEIVDSPEACCN